MFKSVLLPVDLAAGTGKRRTLAVAADMVQRYDAELHVMTVVPDFGMSIVGSFFDESFVAQAEAEMMVRLDAFCREHLPQGRACKQHVRRGSIYDEILRVAACLGTDCIVMGAHRPELKDYLLGPNAARVMRHAPCTVMVVRGG